MVNFEWFSLHSVGFGLGRNTDACGRRGGLNKKEVLQTSSHNHGSMENGVVFERKGPIGDAPIFQ